MIHRASVRGHYRGAVREQEQVQGPLQRSDRDAVLPVMIGTIAWAVALVVTLVMRATLEQDGRGWWIGVAVVGTISGILGTAWLLRRRRRLG